MSLRAPFPWFGGKSRCAAAVWQRFGEVGNYVEPFFGSGAVLLGRPGGASGIETVNDKDGFIANAWRAIAADPEAVAHHADWPVNENDLHARHAWLVGQRDTLVPRLEGDPDFYDPKIAGWWLFGIACWIGSGFCSGRGPWSVVDGQLVHLGSAGQGVNRKRVHLGDAGRGVNRQRVAENAFGEGVSAASLVEWMQQLRDRLRNVRVCCGDWSRVCGPSPTFKLGLTAVFLDPPYSADAGRAGDLYRVEDLSVAHAVREWAVEAGRRPDMRVALAGYEGEHTMPEDWSVYEWKAKGGYGGQSQEHDNPNAARERIWFSPACLPVVAAQGDLFGAPMPTDDPEGE